MFISRGNRICVIRSLWKEGRYEAECNVSVGEGNDRTRSALGGALRLVCLHILSQNLKLKGVVGLVASRYL